MAVVLLAALVAIACVAASARRLYFAASPTALDPARVLSALRGDQGRARYAQIAAAMRADDEAPWERALFEALAQPADVRAALVNEQLMELDFTTQRWERVPRVCASIASSTGFLLAALALRNGLNDPAAFADDTRHEVINQALTSAVDVAAIGIAGATFCVAALMRARKLARARRDAVDKLVERLETLAAG